MIFSISILFLPFSPLTSHKPPKSLLSRRLNLCDASIISVISAFYIMKKLHFGVLISMMIVSCGDFVSNDTDGISDTVYVPLGGLDQVAIVDVGSDELDFVDINYSDIGNEPHFVVINEINRYGLVTAIKSGYVGCYKMDTDELIDTVLVGDSPGSKL
jgi:hypothetical protein